jgi:hypothetical protein
LLENRARWDVMLYSSSLFIWSHLNLYNGSVHLAYNPSYSACFFSQNSIFLSKKISQQCFSSGL